MTGELTFVTRRKGQRVVEVHRGDALVATIQFRTGIVNWDLLDADSRLISSGSLGTMRKRAVELWCDCEECKQNGAKQ